MKKTAFILFVVTLLSVTAFAQRNSPVYSSSYSTPAQFTNSAGSMHVYANLGWFGTESAWLFKDEQTSVGTQPLSGMIALGGDFEYMMKEDLGMGALLRYYSTGDTYVKTASTSTEASLSSLAIGAFSRFHLPHNQYDFYMSPGLGITSTTSKLTGAINKTYETGTVFTFFIQTGVMYAFTGSMAAGFETTKYLPWSSELNGWLLQDFVVKFRYSL